MAIKKIEDIYINGKNRAWGGYIYNLSYNPSFGEEPSQVTVEVTNESGVFDISKDDLSLSGAPTLIKIGSIFTLYMYPIEYQIGESPSGKTLRVDYVDESVVYLDRKVVKLKTRGMDPQVTESYPNTIVIGEERLRNMAVTENVGQILLGRDNVPSDELGRSLSSELQVSDVDYTFPQLLAKISNIISRLPTLDSAASNYRRDYTGRLREVLSAWCNDLGLGFYWENRKLNFLDLTSAATIQSVKSYIESVKKQNDIDSISSGYSLRDTFDNGVEVFFGKDGEILNETGSNNKSRSYYFTNIRLRDNFTELLSRIAGNELSLFNDRFKAAYYGKSAFLVNLVAKKPENFASTLNGFIEVSPKVPQATVDAITNGTSTYDNRNEYQWYAIKFLPGGNDYFEQIFAKYSAYAKFYGRFFWKKFSTRERASAIFGQQGNFYDEQIPLKNVDVFREYLEPLSEYIPKYDKLSLRGFIEGTGEEFSTQDDFDAPVNGYLIMEIQPQWNPKDSNFLLDLGKYVLIEGDDSSSFFGYTESSSGKNLRLPIFYFGVENNEFSLQKAKAIIPPQESPVRFEAVDAYGGGTFLQGIVDKIQYTEYRAPSSQNVNYYNFTSSTLNEEQVLGASAFYYNTEELNRANFDKAASDLIFSNSHNQTDGFFNFSLTIPGLSISPSPSIGSGLISLSVSIGANGVQSSYKFGNEKMKIRNTDVFYRYYYDSAKKKQERIQLPSIFIRMGRAGGSR